jgi:hypothetical protein
MVRKAGARQALRRLEPPTSHRRWTVPSEASRAAPAGGHNDTDRRVGPLDCWWLPRETAWNDPAGSEMPACHLFGVECNPVEPGARGHRIDVEAA